MSLRCAMGPHAWRIRGVRQWGSYRRGIWEVWSECRYCGKTSNKHIENARRAKKLRAELEKEW